MAFPGMLTGTNGVAPATQNFLRTGHTHEGIDQLVGELGQWARKRLCRAGTIDDFVKSCQSFLEDLHRPHEPLREVVHLDQIRNWKTFFRGGLPAEVTGIRGPEAPHVFTFVRKLDCDANRSSCLAGGMADVMLRSRQFMSDRADDVVVPFLTTMVLFFCTHDMFASRSLFAAGFKLRLELHPRIL